MRKSCYTLACCLLISACGGRVQGGEGSESHWLAACESSAECGTGMCTCGVCTLECTTANQCPDAVPVCVTDPEAALFEGCRAKSTPAGLCGRLTRSNDGDASVTESGTPPVPGTTTTPSTAEDGSLTSPTNSGLASSGTPSLDAGSYRLKAIVQEAPGTTPWSIGIWDSVEGVECEFTYAEDGELRCLPKNTWSLIHVGYSDPNCTEPVFNDLSPATETLPGLRPTGAPTMLTIPLDECAAVGRYTVYEVAAQSAAFYSKIGDTCSLQSWPADWVATNRVAPERFQRGVIERAQASDSYEVNRVAADGVSFTVGLRSRALDADCTPLVTGIAETLDTALCLPPTAATAPYGFFSDVACTTPLAYSFSACEYDFALVAAEDEYWLQRASPYSGAVYGGVSLNECEPQTEDFAVGAGFLELSEERLPLPTLSTLLTGTEQLHLEYMSEGDTWLLPTRYLDVDRDEPCQPVLTETAGLRCLPIVKEVHIGKFEIFADAQCTLPASRCDLLLLEYTTDGVTSLYAPGETPSENYSVYTWQTIDGVKACTKDASLSSGGARVPYCTRGEAFRLDSFPPITRSIAE